MNDLSRSSQPVAPAAASRNDAPAVLDEQALAMLAQLDPSGSSQLFVRVMSTYRKSLARLVGQLVAARGPLDADAMRLAAHTLKSSSGSVGALSLAQLCGVVEAALREGRLEALPATLDALLAEAERVEIAVLHLLQPVQS